jgi:calcineurin-like phosphoesterase family protein
MSAYVISDLHLGHNNIKNLRPFESSEDHDKWILKQWNSIICKRDTVFVLGDIVFNMRGFETLGELRGSKKFILGNHDLVAVENYSKYGKVLPSVVKYKKVIWMSHVPIHPIELRDCINIHGHVHEKTLDDSRYVNVCVEVLDGLPIELKKFY